MKKLFYLASSFLITANGFAQLPVLTDTTKRVAILEEFTGMYCGNCPDGHKISNDLQLANKDKVFAINIHAGSYAIPRKGDDPDFRTTDGTAIDAAADPSGYPAGGVNRGIGTGWAKNRGDWAGLITPIIAENAPVNIALEGNINAITKELVVDVELYYTMDPDSMDLDSANDFLNVVLLQNNVAGPQTDYGDLNPTGWQDKAKGIYNHIHMFRMFLNTKSKGDTISATVTGTKITKQYTITLPNEIADLELVLNDLSLVAYVTEGQNYTSPIITGGHGDVNVNIPAGLFAVDLGISGVPLANETFYDKSFLPKITVKNNSTASIDTLLVSYVWNTTTVLDTVYQTLAGGASYTHTFDAITFENGENTMSYNVSVKNDLQSLDLVSKNNNSSEVTYFRFESTTSLPVEHKEGFESGVLTNSTSYHNNPKNVSVFIADDASGFGKSGKAFAWKNYDNTKGDASSLIWSKLNLTNAIHSHVGFNYAYAQLNGFENDKMEVLVSIDEGENWTSVFKESGSSLKTSNLSSTSFIPTSSKWRAIKVDLTAYDGKPEVMVKIEVTSDGGNLLWLDDVVIGEDKAFSVAESISNISLNLYPNPSNGIVNVSFDLENSENVSIQVYNAIGKMMLNNNLGNKAGSVQQQLDLSELNSGIYFVNVLVGNNTISKKVTLK